MSMTVAQKGAATRAARAEEKRLEDIAFISKNLGPRHAKTTAKKNAVWKGDQPASRKRTSSTAQASEITKKVRETAQDDEEIEEPQVKSKPKASKALRKYAPPPIDIDSESEPDLEPPKKQETVKSKAAAKVVAKPVAPRATKALPAPVVSSKTVKVVPSTRKSAKLVAESASEDEQVSSEEPSDESDLSDASGAQNDDDEGPDDEEFANELPQVIRAQSHVSRTATSESGVDSDESREIDDVAPRQQSKSRKRAQAKNTNGPANLFESDDEMPDAPSRFTIRQVRAAHSSEYALDEAIADALVAIPLPTRTHSRRSSTGSGWSSGMDLTIPDSEPDSGGDSEPDAPAPALAAPRKPKKVSTAQQKKADLEKPKVRPPPARGPAPGGKAALIIDVDRPESSWHVSTRLVLPAPNKDIGLNAQRPEVQLVLRGTVDIVKSHLMFTTAYPVMVTRVGWIRPEMIAAARLHTSTIHVLERLMLDPNFAAILSPIPLDRLNIYRGNVKRYAVGIVMSAYKLTELSPAEIKLAVEDLLKNHRYIFGVDPKTGQLQLSLPFHHTAMKLTIKDQMMSSPVFKGHNYSCLPATHPKYPTEREAADPMVALAATAVYASLLELRMTGQRQPIAFTEDAFEDIYRIHIQTLESTRAAAPISMHKVLHQLFNDVTANTKTSPAAAGSSATLINLVDVPESD